MKASKSIKARALDMIESSEDEGVTTSDITNRFGELHQTVSARVHELIKEGKIKDSGKTKKTSTGVEGKIWVATTSDERLALASQAATKKERVSERDQRISDVHAGLVHLSYDQLHNVLDFLAKGAPSIKTLGDMAIRDYIVTKADAENIFGD